jgi:hypothetical protein
MEWLKRLTVDARRDERTIKSALSALSRASSLKTGIFSNLTCLPDGHRELTENPTSQALPAD